MAFEPVPTNDGSPTYLSPISGEPMHNRSGAWSETAHIYWPAIDWTLKNASVPRFKVVGLGLGYIEMALFAIELKSQLQTSLIESFETSPILVNQIHQWIQDQPFEARGQYELIAQKTVNHFDLSLTDLRASMAKALREKRWKLRGNANGPEFIESSCHCLLFDAFSEQTSPELWTRSFLERAIDTMVTPSCFSTYAAKGVLTRILKEKGFTVTRPPGFGGKRESTFATKTTLL